MEIYMKSNRILLAATGSGCGKTTITCGLLAYFKRQGMKLSAVKCGPDYIDPMFHRKVLGIPSGNLDTFFTKEETTCRLLSEKMEGKDLTIIEGVMGYYDGLGGKTEIASAYELAKVTRTPVILIVNAKGVSVSLAAMIKGMIEFHSDSNIKGIILNQVSAGYYQRIKEVIENVCKVKVIGYLPTLKSAEIPSRHLGLVSPEEIVEFQEWSERIADEIEKTIDTEAFLRIAEKAPKLKTCGPSIYELMLQNYSTKEINIAIARDEAFSFYYQENIELLEKCGANIKYFSPLKDKHLPEDVNGIILWGGYPEKYAKELSENETLRNEIKEKVCHGLPCIAECGGFLYLQKELEGEDKHNYPMVGLLSGSGFGTGKLCRFGYLTVKANKNGMLGKNGMTIRGHEFHHWDTTENGTDFTASRYEGKSYKCMVHTKNLFAGFPHFYYYSNPEMVINFLTAVKNVGKGLK